MWVVVEGMGRARPFGTSVDGTGGGPCSSPPAPFPLPLSWGDGINPGLILSYVGLSHAWIVVSIPQVTSIHPTSYTRTE